MAASRSKGIAIEIGGDTTKLQTALKGVNTEIRNTQAQLPVCRIDGGKECKDGNRCFHLFKNKKV